MAIWFNQTKVGSIENVLLFKENGADKESQLAFSSGLVKIAKTMTHFAIASRSTTKLTGYKIMNDKKALEPKDWNDKDVIILIQHVPEVKTTYQGTEKVTVQMPIHAKVSEYLETLDLGLAYECKNLTLTHDESLIKMAFPTEEDLASDPTAAVMVSKLRGMIAGFEPIEEALLSTEWHTELEKVDKLLAAYVANSGKSGGSGGNRAPAETEAQRLASRKEFFLHEIETGTDRLFFLLGERGIEGIERLELIAKIMGS